MNNCGITFVCLCEWTVGDGGVYPCVYTEEVFCDIYTEILVSPREQYVAKGQGCTMSTRVQL